MEYVSGDCQCVRSGFLFASATILRKLCRYKEPQSPYKAVYDFVVISVFEYQKMECLCLHTFWKEQVL